MQMTVSRRVDVGSVAVMCERERRRVDRMERPRMKGEVRVVGEPGVLIWTG